MRRLEPLKMPDGGELRFAPFGEQGERWLRYAQSLPDATLYHKRPWLDLLAAAYGIEVHFALLEYNAEPVAGCLFARSSRPFARRLVSLPDSEICSPLANDRAARDALLRALATHPRTRSGFEIHGVDNAPGPWHTVDSFAQWNIDLGRPVDMLHKSLDRDLRRNMRHAEEQGIMVSQGNSIDYLRRFYALHLDTRRRLGVPPRSFHYFKLLHRYFSSAAGLSVWIASHDGRDQAGLVMLRDGDTLHAKMNARSQDCTNGANHLMFVTAMDEFAGRMKRWDLGRADVRNRGLTDFKRRLGATPSPLPYAYLPRAPRNISSEVLGGPLQIASQAWRWLPLWSTRALGKVVYGFLV